MHRRVNSARWNKNVYTIEPPVSHETRHYPKLEQALRQATADARTEASSKAANTKTEKGGSNTYPAAYPYLYNVANNKTAEFYKSQQTKAIPAPEINMPPHALLMQCRYCLRHAMGICTRQGAYPHSLKGPLYLRMTDGRRFKLQFDCARCQMNVIADK